MSHLPNVNILTNICVVLKNTRMNLLRLIKFHISHPSYMQKYRTLRPLLLASDMIRQGVIEYLNGVGKRSL